MHEFVLEFSRFLEEMRVVDDPCQLIGQDRQRLHIGPIKAIFFATEHIECAQYAVRCFDRYTEFCARVFFLWKGNDAPGVIAHVIGHDGIARRDDMAYDAFAHILAISLGEVLFVNTGSGFHDHLVRMRFEKIKRDMLVIETLLHFVNNASENFIWIEG